MKRASKKWDSELLWKVFERTGLVGVYLMYQDQKSPYCKRRTNKIKIDLPKEASVRF